MASPRIFPGQSVEAVLSSTVANVQANVYLSYYGENDEPATFDSDVVAIAAGESKRVSFTVPSLPGPIFQVGVHLTGASGSVYLEAMKWFGAPEVTLEQPRSGNQGSMWRRAWVNGVDMMSRGTEMFRLIQNQGMGLIMQGTREWRDYSVSASVTPHLARRCGIAARVQGLTRFYGLLLASGNRLQLTRMLHQEEVLGDCEFEWHFGETYQLSLEVNGNRLTAKVDGIALLEATDDALDAGAVGLVIEEGRIAISRVQISAVGA